LQQAQEAAWQAVTQAVASAEMYAAEVHQIVLALVGPKFGVEFFGRLLPKASYRYYNEVDVVFAHAGICHLHGVAVVAGTVATAWAIRAEDGRQAFMGG
jgi:hypothetical protein